MSFNKVIIEGRLTRDLELRYTKSQTAVVNMTVATNYGYGDKEETAYIDVTAWGKTAEACSEYLGKGLPVLIEGHWTQQTYDKEGVNITKNFVTAENVVFLGNRGGGNSQEKSTKPIEKKSAPKKMNQPKQDDEFGDDVPF